MFIGSREHGARDDAEWRIMTVVESKRLFECTPGELKSSSFAESPAVFIP
jgi:hypothetical protein